MEQVIHGSATTTEAVHQAIQHSQESLRALAKRYGVNPKTIAKWKGRTLLSTIPNLTRYPCIAACRVSDLKVRRTEEFHVRPIWGFSNTIDAKRS
jgi:hypothetical protein